MSRDPIDNADEPPEVDIHDSDKQLPPAEAAANRVLEYVGWFGSGLIDGDPAGFPLFSRDLEAVAKAATTPLPKVLDFINERREYVQATRSGPMGDNDADYHRWQGHMEARRQLAEALGYTVPYGMGDRTAPKAVEL